MQRDVVGLFLLIFNYGIRFWSLGRQRSCTTLYMVVNSFLLRGFLAVLRLNSLIGKIFLIDLTAFEGGGGVRMLLYSFYLPMFNLKLFIAVEGGGGTGLESGSDYFHGLTWLEREVFEFFGCRIQGMFDTRHLLLDYTFSGHPLLNQFPVCGFEEVFFDSRARWLVYRPLRLRDEDVSCDW